MKYRYPYHNKHSDRVSILPRDLRAHRSFLHAVVLAHAGQDGAQRLVCLLGGRTELCVFLAVRVLNILGFGKHGPNNGSRVNH